MRHSIIRWWKSEIARRKKREALQYKFLEIYLIIYNHTFHSA